jgi:syntaxin 1B/2/3
MTTIYAAIVLVSSIAHSHNMQDITIIEACRKINDLLTDIDKQLAAASKRSVSKPGLPPIDIRKDISENLTAITAQIRDLTSSPESRSLKDAAEVRKVISNLDNTRNRYTRLERDLQTDAERQFRVVYPEATVAQTKKASPYEPIFQQAVSSVKSLGDDICFCTYCLLQLHLKDRAGQASSTSGNVKERHEAVQNIEGQMIELAETFRRVDELTWQHEQKGVSIEEDSGQAHKNIVEASKEVGEAVKSSRSRNRKKWWCVLVVVLIIVVIVVVVVAVTVVMRKARTA